MCGRFSLGVDTDRLIAEFGLLDLDVEHTPRFNIAPTQPVGAVVRGPDGLRFGTLRWGLVPRDAQAPPRAPLINARSETAARRRSFASSFRRRRCWILADGFYEWRTGSDGARKPYHLRLPDGRPFAMAGVWDRWLPSDPGRPHRDPLFTCAILTTRAAPAIAEIHDRMPVLLSTGRRDAWIDADASPDALAALCEPFDGELEVRPVSTRVNSVANDDPGCQAPPASETSLS